MECPTCGALVPAAVKFCKKCGTPIKTETAPAPTAEGNTCPACNRENAPGVKYCKSCGAPLPAPPAREKTLPPLKTATRPTPRAKPGAAPAKPLSKPPTLSRAATAVTVPSTVQARPLIKPKTIPEGICPSCRREMILQLDRKKPVVFIIISVVLDLIGGCLCLTLAGAFVGIPLLLLSLVFWWGGIAGLILAKKFIYVCPNCSSTVKPPGRAAQDAAATKQMVILGAVMIVLSLLALLCVGGSCASMLS
jgi:hypothetical protein